MLPIPLPKGFDLYMEIRVAHEIRNKKIKYTVAYDQLLSSKLKKK